MISNNTILRTGASFSVVIILAYCSYIATHRGLAAVYAWPGKNSIATWEKGKRHMRELDWMMARAAMEKALPYDSNNPDLLHDLGTAYDAGLAYYPVGDVTAEKNRGKAYQFYLGALAGRPTWPHDWIALALVKYRLNQTDAGFYQALHQAVALGPWEPSVKLVVADIGMHHWDKLDKDMRALVTGIVRNAVNNKDTAMDMLKLASRYGMLDMVCTDVIADESVSNYCKQYYHR